MSRAYFNKVDVSQWLVEVSQYTLYLYIYISKWL